MFYYVDKQFEGRKWKAIFHGYLKTKARDKP